MINLFVDLFIKIDLDIFIFLILYFFYEHLFIIQIFQSANIHIFDVESEEIWTISSTKMRNNVIVPKESFFCVATGTS